MVTRACMMCWNARQRMSKVEVYDQNSGELVSSEVQVCGTCQREVNRVVEFLRFAGFHIAQTPQPPSSNLTEYGNSDSEPPSSPADDSQ